MWSRIRSGAEIVERNVDWPWSSLSIRIGEEKDVVLSDGPVELPSHWVKLVDKAAEISDRDRELIETCLKRGRPMGESGWTNTMAARLRLQSTLRPRGRPRKGV